VWSTVPFSVLAVIVATVAMQVASLEAVRRIGELPPGLPDPSLAFLDPAQLGALPASGEKGSAVYYC
jgi:SulP family sulfate permease